MARARPGRGDRGTIGPLAVKILRDPTDEPGVGGSAVRACPLGDVSAVMDDLHPTPTGHRIIGEALAPLMIQAHEPRP